MFSEIVYQERIRFFFNFPGVFNVFQHFEGIKFIIVPRSPQKNTSYSFLIVEEFQLKIPLNM